MPPFAGSYRTRSPAPQRFTGSSRSTGGAHTMGRIVHRPARLKPLLCTGTEVKPQLRTGVAGRTTTHSSQGQNLSNCFKINRKLERAAPYLPTRPSNVLLTGGDIMTNPQGMYILPPITEPDFKYPSVMEPLVKNGLCMTEPLPNTTLHTGRKVISTVLHPTSLQTGHLDTPIKQNRLQNGLDVTNMTQTDTYNKLLVTNLESNPIIPTPQDNITHDFNVEMKPILGTSSAAQDKQAPKCKKYVDRNKLVGDMEVKACGIHRSKKKQYVYKYMHVGECTYKLLMHIDDNNNAKTDKRYIEDDWDEVDTEDANDSVADNRTPDANSNWNIPATIQDSDSTTTAHSDKSVKPLPPFYQKAADKSRKQCGLGDLFRKMKANLAESMNKHTGEDEFVTKHGVLDKDTSSRFASTLENRRQIVNVVKEHMKNAKDNNKPQSTEEEFKPPEDTNGGGKNFEFVHAVTRGVFCEPGMVTRPVYFNEHMMNMDINRTGPSMLTFSEDLKKPPGGEDSGHRTICQIRNELVCLPHKFPVDAVPITSLRIQWRLSHHGKSPSLQMAFILLNRYGSLLCLIRMSANSACAVFETVAAAERVMGYLCPAERPRMLIGDWWHKKCINSNFRLSQQPLDPAVEWLYVRFYGQGKKNRASMSEYDNIKPRFSQHLDYTTPPEIEDISDQNKMREKLHEKAYRRDVLLKVEQHRIRRENMTEPEIANGPVLQVSTDREAIPNANRQSIDWDSV